MYTSTSYLRVLFALEGNQEGKKARKIVLAGKVEEILKVYLRVKQEETRALNNQCVNLCVRAQEMGQRLNEHFSSRYCNEGYGSQGIKKGINDVLKHIHDTKGGVGGPKKQKG